MLKRVSLRGIDINYFDLNDNKENTIILIHGNSQNLKSFEYQLASHLFQNYRVIALDLPGHGSSSRDSFYNLPRFAEYLSEFIQTLNLEDYVLVGHSLGGHIAIEALELLRAAGVFIFGTPPVTKPIHEESFLPNPIMGCLYKNILEDKEILDILNSFHAHYIPGDKDVALFRKTDHNFRESFAQSLGADLFKDEVEIWQNFTGPKALVLGTQDSLVNRDYVASVLNLQDLWQEKILLLSGGHAVHIDNPQEFNETLRRFLDFCFTSADLHDNRSLNNLKMENNVYSI